MSARSPGRPPLARRTRRVTVALPETIVQHLERTKGERSLAQRVRELIFAGLAQEGGAP